MKVMTLYAHPADTITNCGGTLALHAENGDEVVALIMTHGGRIHANKYAEEWRKENPDQAILNSGMDEIANNKKGELERAAAILGISKLILLDFDDNYVTVREEIVDRIAQEIAKERPDVIICDYPMNVAFHNPHTLATLMAFAALSKVSLYLKNLDGESEFVVKQIFMTSFPVQIMDGLSLYGQRNDLFIDITPVVGKKVRAMDEFKSQEYSGLFTRKMIESHNGAAGTAAGVNFAEAYIRLNNETHSLLPVTAAAMSDDMLTIHVKYSEMNLREMFPIQK